MSSPLRSRYVRHSGRPSPQRMPATGIGRTAGCVRRPNGRGSRGTCRERQAPDFVRSRTAIVRIVGYGKRGTAKGRWRTMRKDDRRDEDRSEERRVGRGGTGGGE